MAGIYGNDPEDRYFENKLINHENECEEMQMPQCKKCGNSFVEHKSDARLEESYCSADCEYEHVMDVMEKHDFLDGDHLNQYLVDAEKLREKCDLSLQDIDEIKSLFNEIYQNIRRY